jgi:bifunctional non-homologous end joining protein LigD
MSLLDYRRKRSFDKTREPAPGARVEPKRAIFVVQLHHASRRHYDFRLQVGDALKSWAVPKGPSFDPEVKRMAVEVEDHPLSYAKFEGRIPKGQYGGGHVALFDQGVWSSPYDVEFQLAKGHLQFELFGDKLKGLWHLVRSSRKERQPGWFLIKAKDRYASKLEADDLLGDVAAPTAADHKRAGAGKEGKKALVAPLARKRARRVDWSARASKLPKARKSKLRDAAFAPQLAKLADKPPVGDKWLHEIKWDGYRLVTTVVGGKVRIWSRNGIEWTDKVPEIREAIGQLGLSEAAFDGELIAGTGTQADFGLLQATLSGERQGSLSYALFDLLHVEGVSLEAAPLLDRKRLLEQLLKDPPRHLAYSSHIEGDGDKAVELASQGEFEGIICKRADLPYEHGRSEAWKKVKRLESDEFAVVGYTPGKGARESFGSLLLARPDPVHGWSYVGRVGSGFTDKLIADLLRRIDKAGGRQATVHVPAEVDADLRQAKWFEPMFVVEVFIRGIGNTGVLRQPSLKAIRPDKDVADLQRDAKGAGNANKAASARAARKEATTVATTKKATKAAKTAKAALPPVKLSSPQKLLFPEDGISKQQVFDYYRAVMPRLLPEIANRPLSVIRCPDGTGKQCFFQKHHTPGLDRVGQVRLKEEGGNSANYLVAFDEQAVLELVQFNSLEFHPWGAHADDPEHADRIVFDLDPGPGVPWAEVKRAALQVRDVLKTIKLKSFLRTTGGKGLHVVVPLNPPVDWGTVKAFAKGVAEAMAAAEPQRFLSTSTLKLRPKKIFIDYLRNGRGATAVASYSLRGRPGAPVAFPLAWSELAQLKRGDAYTLRNVPALLKGRRDPWAGFDSVKQDLSHLE